MSERTSPTTSAQRMHQCPSCGMFGDSGYPDNGDSCPECGEDFPKEPTHMLVPLASYVALDEVERLSEAVKAIKTITREGLYDYDGDDMQEALEMIARHCAIALVPPPAREEGKTP